MGSKIKPHNIIYSIRRRSFMNISPLYIEKFISSEDSEKIFFDLINLKWEERRAARKEYMMGYNNENYTYDNQTYLAMSFTPSVELILHMINTERNTKHNLCFLNRYDTQHNALGWHFDANIASGKHESPAGEIAVISFGAEREIWWREKNFKGKIPKENRQILHSGSLFIMPKGFQEIYYHKIPKHDKPCGIRISLTFRTYED